MLWPMLLCFGLAAVSAQWSSCLGQGDEGAPTETGANSGQADQEFVMNIEVNLLNLFVTVVDQKGRVVRGLEKEDFYLWEGGERREISNFSADADAPLSIAVMLDVSGSMGLMQKLSNSRMAVRQLEDSLHDPDQVALFTFAGTSVAPVLPFTTDRHLLVEQLEAMKPYGKTALYRAIEEVPEMLGMPDHRSAILLLTDGIDNCSQQPLEDVLNSLARRRIPIYTICFIREFFPGQTPEEYVRIPVLQDIAGRSGGAYMDVRSPAELHQGLKGILAELRHQYLLGFRAGGQPDPAERLDIRLLTSNSRHIVRVGRGFYADRSTIVEVDN